ncbi:MAG: hypothetical protein AAGD38_11460 [Acidobacteriota bacterium]
MTSCKPMQPFLLAAILIVGIALPAHADNDLSYNYLELRSTTRSLGTIFDFSTDQLSATLDTDDETGFGIAGSVALGSNFYLTGEYLQDLDVGLTGRVSGGGESATASGTMETRYARLALGARIPLNDNADLITELGAEGAAYLIPGTVSATLPSGVTVSVSEEGVDEIDLDAKVGLRYLAAGRWELGGHLRYSQLILDEISPNSGDIELTDGLLYGVSVMVYLGRGLGIGATYETGDNDRLDIQLRWRF